MPYWQHSIDRAVAVAGYDDDSVFINDPDHDEAQVPSAVPRGDFELAWLERDNY